MTTKDEAEMFVILAMARDGVDPKVIAEDVLSLALNGNLIAWDVVMQWIEARRHMDYKTELTTQEREHVGL